MLPTNEFEEALCIPNFGSSEGIYLDISLACRNSDGKRYFQSFATGKTLGETADDYFRMFRIAAECSLMLNGRGFSYERNNVDIVLTGKEAAAVANSVELDLCGYLEPEAEALLSSALDKFTGVPCTAIQTITCHGRDDYAVWNVEIPSDMFRSIVREAAEKVGTLEELMDSMDATTGCEMRLLTQMKDGRFAFFSIPERMNGLRDYETQGSSVRGSKEQIMAEIFTDWEPAEEPEKKSGVGGILVVLLIVALGGGAAVYIFKQKKAKPQTKGSADLDDYDYGEDEYEFEPYEDESEQDTTEDTDA